MSVYYAREKLWLAVHSLATDEDRIQGRLERAGQLLIRLEPSDFPDHLSDVFSTLLNELTNRRPVGSKDAIQATTSQLSAEEGTKLAERIVRLYTAVDRAAKST